MERALKTCFFVNKFSQKSILPREILKFWRIFKSQFWKIEKINFFIGYLDDLNQTCFGSKKYSEVVPKKVWFK